MEQRRSLLLRLALILILLFLLNRYLFGAGNNNGMIGTFRSNVAIATIALGPKARFFASYLITSFVRNSNFNGTLYLITDDASYFDSMSEELDASAVARVRFLVMSNGSIAGFPIPRIPLETIVKENRYGIVTWSRHTDYKRKRLEIKWLKTKIFNIIPQHDYLIFMDSDILIGKDMNPFVEDCLNLQVQNEKQTVLTLFKDIGHTGSPYHTGVIFLSRLHSASLLDMWGRVIAKGIFGSDQRAIEYAINVLKVQDRVAFVSVDKSDAYFCFIDGQVVDERIPYTFVHTTYYRLLNGALYNFTNETLGAYFSQVLHTPWKPWTGERSMSFAEQAKMLEDAIASKLAYIERLEAAPFPRPTVIAARRDELKELQQRLAAVAAQRASEVTSTTTIVNVL